MWILGLIWIWIESQLCIQFETEFSPANGNFIVEKSGGNSELWIEFDMTNFIIEFETDPDKH